LHFVVLEGLARSRKQKLGLEWKSLAGDPSDGTPDPSGWQTIAPYQTVPAAGPQGLFGTIRGGSALPEQRLDGTIATGALRDEVNAGGSPFVAEWRGYLRAPRTGVYDLSLRSGDPVQLKLDGETVIRTNAEADTTNRRSFFLRAGRHPVVLTYRVNGSGGGLEWSWTPPGGRESIVPPSALEPPPGKGASTRPPNAPVMGYARDVPLVVVN
jgi:hypothetical protein